MVMVEPSSIDEVDTREKKKGMEECQAMAPSFMKRCKHLIIWIRVAVMAIAMSNKMSFTSRLLHNPGTQLDLPVMLFLIGVYNHVQQTPICEHFSAELICDCLDGNIFLLLIAADIFGVDYC